MKYLFLLMTVLVSCSTGLKASSDDESGCMDGWERDQQYRCVPVSSGSECETETDCTVDKCPPESLDCTCIETEGVCVPTCFSSDDCPEVGETDLECNSEGLCIPIEDAV